MGPTKRDIKIGERIGKKSGFSRGAGGIGRQWGMEMINKLAVIAH